MTKNSREVELQADNERLKRKIDAWENNLESIKRSKLEL